jgi:UDP-glucose 4-epimerase
MRRVFVTGAAGFIGSNLVDRLLAMDLEVCGYDNLSTGQMPFLSQALAHPRFRFVEGDLLESHSLTLAMEGYDSVFHLAANADVRFGMRHPRRDLEQNTLATFNLLESIRQLRIQTLAFASTGSIYGDATVVPTPEDAPFPVQTSLYGASKLAAEGLISAYVEALGLKAIIFRFVSILGPRYSHGHVFDFMRQLMADPSQLAVLGNGRQRKSYLHVQDCLDAVMLALTAHDSGLAIYNLGCDATIEVNDSIAIISDKLGLSPTISYSGGERGWVGDSPLIHLDTRRIRALGWAPRFSIEESIRSTVEWLGQNAWVFGSRS